MKICPVEAEPFHTDRRTDRYGETNSRFSQFCESAEKSNTKQTKQKQQIQRR